MKTLPWDALPRFALGHWPTPLEPLPRLSAELGGPKVWLKRDDCSGLATGGNKTRKLEYLLGDAVASGADSVVTFGAVQSNHTRQTAAACAKAGLMCHQILTRTVQKTGAGYETGGNVLLSKVLGAQQHIVAPTDAKAYSMALVEDLQAKGNTAYVIPAGGSNALGAVGYAQCAQELCEQAQEHGFELEYVMHASASAGTQAGLLFGLQHLQAETQVLGVNVYHPDPAALSTRVEQLVRKMNDTYAPSTQLVAQAANVNHAYIGPGYGQPSAQCLDAIRTVARLEGILFDPVYSGKALAALIDQVTLGNLSGHKDVVLIHTGGSPALYVYEDAFA